MDNRVYAFETDTVWGFGCSPADSVAIEKIYEIKNRDRSKPLILMSFSLEQLLPYVCDVHENALALMQKAYPGALTVVLKRSSLCPEDICAGFDTVGIRVPAHKGFHHLCKSFPNGVLATTSANISNEPPCASYEETLEKFGHVCDVIAPIHDSEPAISGAASTVVTFLPCGTHKIIRQGDYIV
jgi:L-threonylcarbamoyladenylate synthase